METNNAPRNDLEPVFSLSELATRLRVSVQTIYDLRSQGRGPRGFRVGRELRFRVSEVDAWLARMEQADGDRPDLESVYKHPGLDDVRGPWPSPYHKCRVSWQFR